MEETKRKHPEWFELEDNSNSPRRKPIQKHRCRVWRLVIAPVVVLDGPAGMKPTWYDGYHTSILGPSEFRSNYKVDRFGKSFATLAEAKRFVIEKATADRERSIKEMLHGIADLRRDIRDLDLLRRRP